MDLESCFGFQQTLKSCNDQWDKEFLEHTIQWTNKDTKERLFGIDITKDFYLCLKNNFNDLKQTKSLQAIEEESKYIIYLNNQIDIELKKTLLNKLSKDTFKKYRNEKYVQKKSFQNEIFYKSFSKFTQNFYQFSANGSAQGARIKIQETKMFKKIKKENEVLYDKIKKNYKDIKSASISKTICFGYSGKYLLKFLFWVYGKQYTPKYELNIKSEPKKLRQVANCDLISFSKQTYFFDWISTVLNSNVKKQIHPYFTQIQKLQFFQSSKQIQENEKWNVELDMKDFHIHFGESHYKSFAKIIKQQVKESISEGQIRQDLLLIAKSFKKDLSRGLMYFDKIFLEDNLFQDFIENNYGIKINKQQKDQKSFYYQLTIPIRNGLMSGWKLTSLLGSLFNLSLNQMCEKWNLYQTGGINLNLNVMGDDIHLKRRYLHEAVSHIAFTNLIGKQAHPKKQMISTVMIEFLKTKISQINNDLSYSSINMINQFLYHSKNFNIKFEKNDYLSNQIDILNLFYNRIDEKYRQKLINRNFNFHFFRFSCKLSKKEFKKFEISTYLNNPAIFNSALPGYTRTIRFDFKKKVQITDKIRVQGFNDNFKVYELKLKPQQFQGIRDNVNSITRDIKFLDTFEKRNFNEILIDKIGQKIIEKKGFFTLENNPYFQNKKIEIQKLDQISKFAQNKFGFWKNIKVEILTENNTLFNFKDFIKFALKLFENVIIKEKNYQGVIGQLIYIDEQVSQTIYQIIKRQVAKDDINYYKKIYQNLKNISKTCQTGFQIFCQFCKKYGEDFFFFLSLQNFVNVKISKLFIHDILIGFIGDQMQRFFIIYLIENIPDKNVQLIKDNFLSILCTLDFYIHQNVDNIKIRIQQMLNKKHSMQSKNQLFELFQKINIKKTKQFDNKQIQFEKRIIKYNV